MDRKVDFFLQESDSLAARTLVSLLEVSTAKNITKLQMCFLVDFLDKQFPDNSEIKINRELYITSLHSLVKFLKLQKIEPIIHHREFKNDLDIKDSYEVSIHDRAQTIFKFGIITVYAAFCSYITCKTISTSKKNLLEICEEICSTACEEFKNFFNEEEQFEVKCAFRSFDLEPVFSEIYTTLFRDFVESSKRRKDFLHSVNIVRRIEYCLEK